MGRTLVLVLMQMYQTRDAARCWCFLSCVIAKRVTTAFNVRSVSENEYDVNGVGSLGIRRSVLRSLLSRALRRVSRT